MNKNYLLETKGLSVGYTENTILEKLSLKVLPGDLICLMGPNGSGKSTLLRTLVGLNKSLQGDVFIDGKNTKDILPKNLSKLVSIVLTERGSTQGLTVEDIVRLGRFPHTNMWGKLEEKDREIVNQSIELLNLEKLRGTLADELSDGQLQKVFIARALAQDTPVIILDEPTTFLDIANKMELMSVLERISKEKNKALIFSSHDWELALEKCPKVWLIDSKDNIKTGAPEEFLYSGVMQKLFMHEKFFLNNKNGRFCELKNLDKEIKFECENSVVFQWTSHALAKIGFKVSEQSDLSLVFNNNLFQIEGGPQFVSLTDLLDFLKLR